MPLALAVSAIPRELSTRGAGTGVRRTASRRSFATTVLTTGLTSLNPQCVKIILILLFKEVNFGVVLEVVVVVVVVVVVGK